MKGFLQQPSLCLYCLSLTRSKRQRQNGSTTTKARPASEFLLPLWDPRVSTPFQGFPGQHCRGDPIHTSKGMEKQHIVLAEAAGEAGLCQVTRESRSCFQCSTKTPLENNPSQGIFKPLHSAEAADTGTQRGLPCSGEGTIQGRGCLHSMGEHTKPLMERGTTQRGSTSHNSKSGFTQGNGGLPSHTGGKGSQPKSGGAFSGGHEPIWGPQPTHGETHGPRRGGLHWGA